jgi:hypothetical protein
MGATTFGPAHIIPRDTLHLGIQFTFLTLYLCRSKLPHSPSSIFRQLMAPRLLISMSFKVSHLNQVQIHLPSSLLRINPISLASTYKHLQIRHPITCLRVPMGTISTKQPRRLTKSRSSTTSRTCQCSSSTTATMSCVPSACKKSSTSTTRGSSERTRSSQGTSPV